ncbi:sirohydrochlorin cobaltochelatase [Lentisphaerota bacterium ZTH]|nr:sirohydrochlorin cobaltochelatase [Lentisphaerota bacterium]WET07548.1 sirohydrochlorin cobaltochelatase [Lentisphaerota bacterium ZTH]
MRKYFPLGGAFKLIAAITAIGTFSLAQNANSAQAASPTSKKDTAILLVAFGTSVPRAEIAYTNIDRLVKKNFPGIPVKWAYTSSIIRRKLAKQGKKIDSVEEALRKLYKAGYKKVAIQSLHITNGQEYQKIVSTAKEFFSPEFGFEKIKVGNPMLLSYGDLKYLVSAVRHTLPGDRRPQDAVVLMGHGNEKGIGDLSYVAAAYEFSKEDPKIFVGTVEGAPSFDDVKEQLIKAKVKKAFLIPMMVVAGDHAMNDMAGDEPDSWKSQLEKSGIQCVPYLHGLGENDQVMQIFVKHLEKVLKSFN